MSRTFPYRYRVLVLLFFFIVITYLDRICISLVGVRIKTAFNLSNEQFGWVLGSFALAYALFEIPTGVLGDRIGQRAVFIRIVLWWSLFTALTGACTGLLTLMATRFMFGIGEAGAIPNSAGAISRWLPASETARGSSWIVIGTSTGAAIAPFIVIPVAAAYGWQAPFFINGFIGLLWVLVCYLWFRNEPAEMKTMPKEEKAFIEKNRRYISQGGRFAWKDAFKNRNMIALVTAFFSSQWALYFFIAWMPVYLQEGRHFSENTMKITISYLFVMGIIGGFSAGFFCDWLVKRKGLKFGRRLMGTLSLSIMGLLFFIAAATSGNTVAAGCLILANFFLPVFLINSLSVCIDIGKNRASTVAGIMNFCGQLGSFFIAIVFGKFADATHSFNSPLYIIAAVLFTGSLFWAAVDAGKPLQANTAEQIFYALKPNNNDNI
jgi:MFS transporter, ACS family, glucarate transporter